LHFDELADGLLMFAPLFWPATNPDGTLHHVIPDAVVREAWGLLCEVGQFNMQPKEFSSREEFSAAVCSMHEKLIRYAELAEQVCCPISDTQSPLSLSHNLLSMTYTSATG
jgi:hypothetical protein